MRHPTPHHSLTVAPLLLALLATAPALCAATDQADPSLWEQTKDKVDAGWEATKEGTAKAANWTQETSKKGWEATKNGATGAVDWTAEKTKAGWEATQQTATQTDSAQTDSIWE